MAILNISYKSTDVKIVDDMFVTLTDIVEGDLIVAFSGGFPGATGQPIFIEDTAGNDWLGGYDCGHFYTTKVWFAFAIASGPTTIKISSSTGYATLAAATNYRGNTPQFAEVVFPLGYYVPAVNPTDYPLGVGTASFSLARNFIVTVMCTNAVSHTTGLILSDTGDTRRNPSTTSADRFMWVFDREQSAADNFGGNAIVQLKGPDEAFSQFPMISLVFMEPLAETDPTRDRQYQVKSGSGYDHYNPAAFATCGPSNLPATNRPLTITLPMLPIVDPLLGKMAMLTVGVMTIGEIDVNSLSVQDEYTNAYDLQIYSAGFGGLVHIAIFRTVISNPTRMPGFPLPFQISLNINPQTASDSPYQHCAIGVAERTVYGLPGTAATAGFKQMDDHNPSFRLISNAIPSVPKDDYIFFFGAFDAGINQDSVVWSFRDSYVGTSSGLIQFPSVQANAPRLGPCIVGDKIAPSLASYDAQADGLLSGTFGLGGGIAMVAMSVITGGIPLPPIPPVPTPPSPILGRGNCVLQDRLTIIPTKQ